VAGDHIAPGSDVRGLEATSEWGLPRETESVPRPTTSDEPAERTPRDGSRGPSEAHVTDESRHTGAAVGTAIAVVGVGDLGRQAVERFERATTANQRVARS
jgi:hypothetical protein